MKTYPAVHLSTCGDQLDALTYSNWCLQSVNTTYAQIYAGTCLVEPFTLKPSPRWRRSDCEAQMARRDLVLQQRKARVKARMSLVQAS